MPVRSPGVLLFGLAVMLWTHTGCSEEPRAEPSLGQVERTETITAADLVLVTNGRGVARMVGTLVNDAEEEDRLVGLDIATDVGEYSVTSAEGPIVLPTDEPVKLARDTLVTVLSDSLRPGCRADIRLSFRNSETITTTVPHDLRAVLPSEGHGESTTGAHAVTTEDPRVVALVVGPDTWRCRLAHSWGFAQGHIRGPALLKALVRGDASAQVVATTEVADWDHHGRIRLSGGAR